MSHIEDTAARIRFAKCPEDLFGVDPDGVNDAYRALAKIIHPDHHQDKPATVQKMAAAALAVLNERKRDADAKIAEGTYGDRKPPKPAVKPPLIKVAGDHLQLAELLRAGDIADVYAGTLVKAGRQVVAKIARDPRDNDLMRNGREVLATLVKKVPTPGLGYFAEAAKASLDVRGRVGNVIVRYPEHVPLDQLKARSAVAYRDMAWMLRRLLEGLSFLHTAGIVHGNLIPPNLLFHPVSHGLRIIDWCYAVPVGKPARARTRGYVYPNEVETKRSLTPATDIYMAVRAARWSLSDAGKLATPQPLRRFLDGCLIDNPKARPNDALALYDELGELLQKLVGPPKYKRLDIQPGESFT